ncbi:MAG TPA: hypothetical protein VHJ20_18970 [Polyangia bacterium]|nr:hypothetical protein [Polyangia bacterium]
MASAKAATPSTCLTPEPAAGPGSIEPFRAPKGEAVALNAAGKIPYRAGKWDEAREKYRAAEKVDPEFLAPRLNVACSYVRQERFAEATAEVLALLDRAYVPWSREIAEAADLGALKVRPEMKQIRAAMAASAARWGEGLDQSVLFVARQRAPLKVPDGPGVFLLNPQQEIWAFSPRTRRTRQLTAEDGHVVAFAPSHDRRSLIYVTADKLVRGARPNDVALRGVSIRRLTLATMELGPPQFVDDDVRELAIHDRAVRVKRSTKGATTFRLGADGRWAEASSAAGLGEPLAKLTPTGVEAPSTDKVGDCGTASGKSGPVHGLQFQARGGPSIDLGSPFGAGLRGLPIP